MAINKLMGIDNNIPLSVTGAVPFPLLGDTGYEDLATALTTIGATETTLCIPAATGAVNVAVNTTIPANVHLRVDKGAYFNISNGVTLTINGTMEAGPYKIFAWAGTGKVAFGTGSIKEALIRWWGAVGDGTTDDTAAVQACLNVVSYGTNFTTNILGTANDIYSIDKITLDYRKYGQNINIIGNGAQIRQRNYADIFELYSNTGTVCFKDWYIQGSCASVWSKAYASGDPTGVTFNGAAGTKKTSIKACTTAKDWYWADNVLYVCATAVYGTDPSTTYTPAGIVATYDGTPTTLTDWTGYFPGIAFHINNKSSAVNFDNCHIWYVGQAFKFDRNCFAVINKCMVQGCNQFLYGDVTTEDGSQSNIVKVTNCHATMIYGDSAIYMEDCYGWYFDNIGLESFAYKSFHFKNCHNIVINNYYDELSCLGVYAPTATESFLFDNVSTIRVSNGSIGIGSGNDHRVVALFKFINACSNVIIDGNFLNMYDSTDGTKMYVVASDGTAQGSINKQ